MRPGHHTTNTEHNLDRKNSSGPKHRAPTGNVSGAGGSHKIPSMSVPAVSLEGLHGIAILQGDQTSITVDGFQGIAIAQVIQGGGVALEGFQAVAIVQEEFIGKDVQLEGFQGMAILQIPQIALSVEGLQVLGIAQTDQTALSVEGLQVLGIVQTAYP